MNNRTVVQTLLLVVAAVVLLGGLVCVVAGFVSLGGSDGAPSLFVAGGFAWAIGIGIIVSTRAATGGRRL